MSSKFGRFCVFGLAVLALAGCATPTHQRLNKIQNGMDKTQVLDLVGNPKRTVRKDDGDLWTFVYYVGDQHFERDVRFTDGHVALISPAREVNPSAASGEAVMKDYESLVNEVDAKRGQKNPSPKSKGP